MHSSLTAGHHCSKQETTMSVPGCQKSYQLCQLLEGLKVDAQSNRRNNEELLGVTEKLSKIIATQERSRKEIFVKHPTSIEQFIDVLKIHGRLHDDIAVNVLVIVNEMLTSGKRISIFLNHELVPVLFQLLTCCSFEKSKHSDVELNFICKILGKVGTKEKSFCVLARLTGALGASCTLLKQCSATDKTLEPLLQVLKLFSKSDVNCNQMASAGLVNVLFAFAKSGGVTKRTMPTLLEVLTPITKSRIGACDTVKEDHIDILLVELAEHLKIENWRFQVPTRKLLLSIVRNAVAHVSGRAAFLDAGGAKMLYKVGLEMITHKEMDDVIKIIILILRSCLEQPLPIASTQSPLYDPSTSGSNGTLASSSSEIPLEMVSETSLSVNECDDCTASDSNATTSSDRVECLLPENPLLPGCNIIRTLVSSRDNHSDQQISVNHVLPFITDTVPSVFDHHPPYQMEPQLQRKVDLHRQMLFHDFNRYLSPEDILNELVYDINESNNALMSIPRDASTVCGRNHTEAVLNDRVNDGPGHASLRFESRFESGNLRKAIRVRSYEYDLILNPDACTNHHHQWFYFRVQGMSASESYRFNVINCEKLNSQFNFGMQPVIYSVCDAVSGRPGWERLGSSICYYKNVFTKAGHDATDSVVRYHYTATFTLSFPHSNDTCFVAYHYPYPYSSLQRQLVNYEMELPEGVYFKKELLCRSVLGNACDVITITEGNEPDTEAGRPYVVLSARVHPGESNSSWVMKGVLDLLCSRSSTARFLRSLYVFKIIPMLNPDGVINGSHRCSIVGDDLNRQWINPDENHQPTIFHAKNLIRSILAKNRNIAMFCDFHGHSRRKHFFLFGCDPHLSGKGTSSSSTSSVCVDIKSIDTCRDANASSPDGDSRSNENDDCVTAAEQSDSPDVSSLPRPRHLSNGSDSSMKSENNCEQEQHSSELRKFFQDSLAENAPSFSVQNCSYAMEKSKASTARIVVFREIGIPLSFTLETSYCGADQGLYKGLQFGTRELEEIGRNFCESLIMLAEHTRLS